MFTGREWLQSINLYDYRNRLYSQELGRFLQTDPTETDSGDPNFYQYDEENPISFTDPFGLKTMKATINPPSMEKNIAMKLLAYVYIRQINVTLNYDCSGVKATGSTADGGVKVDSEWKYGGVTSAVTAHSKVNVTNQKKVVGASCKGSCKKAKLIKWTFDLHYTAWSSVKISGNIVKVPFVLYNDNHLDLGDGDKSGFKTEEICCCPKK